METTARLQLNALKDPGYLADWRLGFWAGISNAALLFIAVAFSTLKPWKNLRRKGADAPRLPRRSDLQSEYIVGAPLAALFTPPAAPTIHDNPEK